MSLILISGFVQDVSIRLSADKRTKMDLIKSVEKKIVQAEINNIIYATQEKDVRARRFSNNGIKLRLKSNRLIENNKENIHFGIRNTYYDIENSLIANDTVVLEIGSKIKMDGVEMDRKMLVTDFKNEIKKNKVFKYLYSNDLEFNDYIYVLSTHLKAVNLLRNNEQKIILKLSDDLRLINKKAFIEEQQQLRDLFPFNMTEKMY